VKQQIAIHGRDHRLGGADPAPMETPWCYVTNESITQTVTATTEVVFSSSNTNDRRTFRWDPSDPNGILVYRRGLYRCWAKVNVNSSDIAVARMIYTTVANLSDGPNAGIGLEFGQGHFCVGNGQGDAGMSEVGSIAKSVLGHISMERVQTIDLTDPMRFAVIAQFDTTSYDIGGTLASTLTVEWVGDIGDDTPAPTDMTP
jgi:hypothetical protein